LTNKNMVPADLLPLSKDSIVARVTPWSDWFEIFLVGIHWFSFCALYLYN
jgi:hypothetical protein